MESLPPWAIVFGLTYDPIYSLLGSRRHVLLPSRAVGTPAETLDRKNRQPPAGVRFGERRLDNPEGGAEDIVRSLEME